MFSHPMAVIGFCAIGVGILLSLMSSGMSYQSAGAAFLLGSGLGSVGAFMVLLGVVAQGFLRIEKHLAGIPQMKAAFEASEKERSDHSQFPDIGAVRDPSKPIDPNELARKLKAKGLSA